MGVQHLVDHYTASGDVISLVICIVLQVIIYWVLYFSEDHKFKFLKLSLIFIELGCVFNLLFAVICKHYSDMTFLIILTRDAYHLCFLIVLELYLIYIRYMMSADGKEVKYVAYLTRVLVVVAAILDVLSPITKWGFYHDGDKWYDPMFSPYNTFYLYAVILMFFMLVLYYKRLIKAVRNCLIFSEALVALFMIFQGIRNINSYTSFTYLLPVFVVMILLHSRPFNDKTGALSGDSFARYVNQNIEKGIVNDYMILKLDLSVIKHMPAELGKVMHSFWRKTFKDATLFNLENDLFVLAIPRKASNGDTETKVKTLFKQEFQGIYAQFQVAYKVIGLFDIDFIKDGEELSGMINYLLSKMGENEIISSNEQLREELKIFNAVRDNLLDIASKNDLDDERIIVYCQPIRNMKTGKFDTAEALMRMSIPEKEFLTPNLFIPVAEFYGYIHTLSRIMLNKVCIEINKLQEEGYRFNRISVNFVASEVIKEDFCNEMLTIIKSNGIEPKKIGIELTESQNEGDFIVVKDRIQTLRRAGMTVYLDDIGTGYSNLDRIVKYDVDVVKFDRFFLLEAEKDKKVVYMMRHLSDAFRDLNYSLLYEGVETDEHQRLCLECGADYIQGYMYSQPLPIGEMRKFFEKK